MSDVSKKKCFKVDTSITNCTFYAFKLKHQRQRREPEGMAWRDDSLVASLSEEVPLNEGLKRLKGFKTCWRMNVDVDVDVAGCVRVSKFGSSKAVHLNEQVLTWIWGNFAKKMWMWTRLNLSKYQNLINSLKFVCSFNFFWFLLKKPLLNVTKTSQNPEIFKFGLKCDSNLSKSKSSSWSLSLQATKLFSPVKNILPRSCRSFVSQKSALNQLNLSERKCNLFSNLETRLFCLLTSAALQMCKSALAAFHILIFLLCSPKVHKKVNEKIINSDNSQKNFLFTLFFVGCSFAVDSETSGTSCDETFFFGIEWNNIKPIYKRKDFWQISTFDPIVGRQEKGSRERKQEAKRTLKLAKKHLNELFWDIFPAYNWHYFDST